MRLLHMLALQFIFGDDCGAGTHYDRPLVGATPQDAAAVAAALGIRTDEMGVALRVAVTAANVRSNGVRSWRAVEHAPDVVDSEAARVLDGWHGSGQHSSQFLWKGSKFPLHLRIHQILGAPAVQSFPPAPWTCQCNKYGCEATESGEGQYGPQESPRQQLSDLKARLVKELPASALASLPALLAGLRPVLGTDQSVRGQRQRQRGGRIATGGTEACEVYSDDGSPLSRRFTMALREDGSVDAQGAMPVWSDDGMEQSELRLSEALDSVQVCPFGAEEGWWRGKVTAMNRDGTYNVLFDDGSTTERIPTVLIGGLRGRRVVQVAGGEHHAMLLLETGDVLTFGYGGYGALGHGDEKNRLTPKVVEALRGKKAIQLAAGDYHSLVLLRGGSVLSFGHGESGALGHGDIDQYGEDYALLTPKLIEALQGKKKVQQVSAGFCLSMVLLRDGRVMSFGDGSGGCTDDYDTYQLVPTIFEGLPPQEPFRKVLQLAVGECHGLALLENGEVMSFFHTSYMRREMETPSIKDGKSGDAIDTLGVRCSGARRWGPEPSAQGDRGAERQNMSASGGLYRNRDFPCL